MGFGIRIFVAVLLTLISLSVLSLHIALCFHYPSALFAVTLLLNPSLWLFVGLMSMFCTFVLNYRDKRRKLVPALCTSCRPKHESAFRFSPRSRCDCNRSYQLPSKGKFSERSLLTCQYSSYSSVHTATHLLPKDDNITEIKGTAQNGKPGIVIESSEDEKRSLESFDSSRSLISDKRCASDDVQNYSCLVKNFREPDVKGNTLVVLNRDGQTKNFYINNNILPKTHSCDITRGTNSLTFSSAHCSRSFKPYITICNSRLTSSKDTLDTKSDTSSECIEDESSASSIPPHQMTETQKIVGQNYHQFKNTEKLVLNSSSSSDVETKRFMRTRCTCPRRKYPPIKNEIQFLGKSNKPIMRCTKPFRTKTPLHLFQAKENQTKTDEEIDKESIYREVDISKEKSMTSNTLRKTSSTELMIREPDTLTSIVSLLD